MHEKQRRSVAAAACWGLAFLCIALVGTVPVDASADENIFKPDQFISPETCGGCHDEIMDQWQNSLHHLSHKDPVYSRVAKFYLEGLTEAGQIEEAESCVKCHTPVGYVTGFPRKVSDELSLTKTIPAQGIQCDYCHVAVDITRMYNNGLVLAPGQGEDDPGVKHGPFDDAEPDFHEAAFSKLHTDSKICGTCHDVKHAAFGTDLETTYTEWKNSVYNSPDPEKHVPCQGCHMYQRPGVPATGSTPRPDNPGRAAADAKLRPHIFTHNFVGANSGVPGMFSAKEKSAMAVERLTHAANIFMLMIDNHTARVVVTNTGAGHSLPTGVGDLRQVWIEVTLTDSNGKTLFQTGVPDKNNELPENTVMFRTIFGDGQGNPVINMARVKEILSDTRIPAGKSSVHLFNLKTKPQKGDTLTARLLYRSMPQKILNQVPGPALGPLPVVEMAAIQKTFY
ncbi:multiheme c-type cytochrome [uncultured Desulfobacter sp.]|uniref:multiheme c-type cytochrome n=1 Tax=uncultured Desulfobacter sp. TaxID=240139 RepID=UPI002AABB829|nr:multiheme c-type cytochrome [uncultured Desulfobacter sp.]